MEIDNPTLQGLPLQLPLLIPNETPIAGTLTLPSGQGPFPWVVIVSGSGPVDRDGNVGRKFVSNVYRDLAYLLAELGLASFRYDKRGVGESGGDSRSNGMLDLVGDIEGIVKGLSCHSRLQESPPFIMGHSEGTMLCTKAATRIPVSGVILLAGGGENLMEAMDRQRMLMYQDLMSSGGLKGFIYRKMKVDVKGEKQAKKLIDRIMSSDQDSIRFQLVRMNAKWFREHFHNDVVEDLRLIRSPVLAITGDKDFQADASKMQRILDNCPAPAKTYTIPAMNHMLKKQDTPMSAKNYMRDYRALSTAPLHPQLVEAIRDWFSDRL